MEKALLVSIKLKTERDNWQLADIAEELRELAITSGAEIIDAVTCVLEKPTSNLFIGKGKTEEISAICQELDVGTVIFSRDLSGTQQRNLEEIIGKKTIDRTQLILDIFARHARIPVGKMQVELAQLQYLMPRLVGKGIMLSRLGGGIGTRGPGEQKLEIDRRCTRQRIGKLKEDLEKFGQHRLTIKKKRTEKELPSVVLVGYTNAGKSTLINALTGSGQVVADSLFTTLDTVSKKLVLPNGEHIIISDTVGFLHNLPHHLIEAFKATLEEVVEADLLIHVLDASHPRVYERNLSVWQVVAELHARDKPVLTALNKIDLVDDTAWLHKLRSDFENSILISARIPQNLEILLSEIQMVFSEKMAQVELKFPNTRMDLVNMFYEKAKVLEIRYLQNTVRLKINLPKITYHNLLKDKDITIIN